MSPPVPTTARTCLLSQALALEGKVTIARLVPPPAAVIAASPATYVDFFRVRIDPVKSDQTDAFVRLDFSDGTSAGLHLRRAVAEFVADPQRYARTPDIVLAMSGETWAKLYLSQATAEDVIRSGDLRVQSGDASEAARIIGLFDRYRPEKAVVIAPAFLEHAH